MNFIEKVDPKGYVIIKNKDGKVLQANFNTIVNEGRKTLIVKLLQNLFGTETNIGDGISADDGKYDFYAVCLGKEMGETTISTVYDSDEYNNLLDGNTNPFWFTFPTNFKKNNNSTEHGISEYSVLYDDRTNRYYLAITINVVPASQLDTNVIKEVCSLAIIMKHRNYNPDKDDFYELDSEGNFTNTKIISNKSNKYRLFSRFRFDAIPMTSESEFIMTYYIYF